MSCSKCRSIYEQRSCHAVTSYRPHLKTNLDPSSRPPLSDADEDADGTPRDNKVNAWSVISIGASVSFS